MAKISRYFHTRVMEFHRAFSESINELMHQRVGGMSDFVRRALRGNPAVGQDDDLVGNPKSFFEVMRHDDGRDAQRVIELANQLLGSAE